MALFEGETENGISWSFDIPEYWTGIGATEDYHFGSPDGGDLLNSVALTGEITYYDDDGNIIDQRHATFYSDDGWTESELAAEADDAADRYEPK